MDLDRRLGGPLDTAPGDERGGAPGACAADRVVRTGCADHDSALHLPGGS